MSAKHENRDGFVVATQILSKEHEAFLSSMFDASVDDDVLEIQMELRHSKEIKKLALIETLIFTPNILLTSLICSSDTVKQKLAIQSIYWRFLTKKITLDQFKLEFSKVYNGSEKI